MTAEDRKPKARDLSLGRSPGIGHNSGAGAPDQGRDEYFSTVGNRLMEALADSSAATLQVAVYIQYEFARRHGETFSFSNIRAAKLGVSRFAKRRALLELVRLGLVEIGVANGQAVTVRAIGPLWRRTPKMKAAGI